MTKALQESGVDIIRGQGKLDGPRRVIVVSNNNNSYTGSDNSNSSNNGSPLKVLVANHAGCLGTGSRGAIPSQIQGLVEARPWTSRNATSAKKAHVHLQ